MNLGRLVRIHILVLLLVLLLLLLLMGLIALALQDAVHPLDKVGSLGDGGTSLVRYGLQLALLYILHPR